MKRFLSLVLSLAMILPIMLAATPALAEENPLRRTPDLQGLHHRRLGRHVQLAAGEAGDGEVQLRL